MTQEITQMLRQPGRGMIVNASSINGLGGGPLARPYFSAKAGATDALFWLCSEAPSYVTGHSLIVDGGLTSPFR